MGNFASKNTQLDVTSGAAHVNVQNTAVTTQNAGTGSSLTIAAGSGSTQALGDLTIYGIPLGSLVFTKTGAAATATITYGIASPGVLMFQVDLTAADAIALSGTSPDGAAMAGPFAYLTSAGAFGSSITADGVYYLYLGR